MAKKPQITTLQPGSGAGAMPSMDAGEKIQLADHASVHGSETASIISSWSSSASSVTSDDKSYANKIWANFCAKAQAGSSAVGSFACMLGASIGHAFKAAAAMMKQAYAYLTGKKPVEKGGAPSSAYVEREASDQAKVEPPASPVFGQPTRADLTAEIDAARARIARNGHASSEDSSSVDTSSEESVSVVFDRLCR